MSENRISSWQTDEAEPTLARELERLNAKLDHLAEAVGRLDRRREELEDWVVDALPAANGALEAASHRLQALERSGSLPVLQEAIAAVDDAARRIEPGALQALAGNAGSATRTARVLTAPEVTSVLERSVAVLAEGRKGRPPSLWSLLRRARKPHVRRGLAVALDLLRVMGEGAHPGGDVAPGAAAPIPPAPVPAPRRSPPPTSSARPRPGPAPAAVSAGDGPHGTLQVGGSAIEVDAEGFLVHPEDWSPEVAEAIAAAEGIAPLTDAHWRIIDYCREDSAGTGSAPGLRKIMTELEIDPKEMYALFPGGPGLLAAKVAGRGKPRSCV